MSKNVSHYEILGRESMKFQNRLDCFEILKQLDEDLEMIHLVMENNHMKSSAPIQKTWRISFPNPVYRFEKRGEFVFFK